MKQIHVLERDAALNQVTHASASEDYALNLTVVYHDARTQSWAREVYDRVASVAGREWVHATWWKVSDLVEPGVLAGAVSTAMRADVVVVAIDAAEGLPLPFHVWIDNWLPHRKQATGCLFALIGRSGPANAHSSRVREYLREVARMGRFEFLLEERRLLAQSAAESHHPVRASRPQPHAVEARALAGVGRGVIHRTA
jgi:hypothetical protein